MILICRMNVASVIPTLCPVCLFMLYVTLGSRSAEVWSSLLYWGNWTYGENDHKTSLIYSSSI